MTKRFSVLSNSTIYFERLNMKITAPVLNEGEIHVGTFLQPDGTGYQLILLPGDNEPANHSTQLEWAASIGGDLPDRSETAFMFKHIKDQFKQTWYWTNESYDAEWAWYQSFNYGHQLSTLKYDKLRARAVRRLVIE
jgi:hypothetical protein